VAAAHTILQRLLGQAAQAGLRASYLLLDKEFYSLEVMAWLQRHNIPVLMPTRNNSKKPPFEPGRAVGWSLHTWDGYPKRRDFATGRTYRAAALRVQAWGCVARHPVKGGRLLYASWGLGRGWSPARVVQEYRRRFGIETKYRQLGQCLAQTSSRVLWVGVALLLRLSGHVAQPVQQRPEAQPPGVIHPAPAPAAGQHRLVQPHPHVPQRQRRPHQQQPQGRVALARADPRLAQPPAARLDPEAPPAGLAQPAGLRPPRAPAAQRLGLLVAPPAPAAEAAVGDPDAQADAPALLALPGVARPAALGQLLAQSPGAAWALGVARLAAAGAEGRKGGSGPPAGGGPPGRCRRPCPTARAAA
jgi:hypothetical protein